ncbi:contractile injection system protein, VgrG/Pvc8 family [Porphyrobacter sp. YT40]|uniref:contractile injection system protein, VgrG/Pvc8 family n=1 Tax=Porphyrobacter sp. YT40 TaxID=2547601 RepID=UPI001144F2C6|nr:contractile injection system protein, VgrG/Pvc8 family [Porphyrobacter sp. YT40]QDH33993.1 phage late control D family protein [Porphyrobacter sp. YT40]
MTSRRAGISLTLEDGTDLADKVRPRLLSLRLSEKREDDADAIDLVLHNTDGLLAVPRTGVRLALALGWESGADVPPGLVDKGRFTIDEIELSGPPDQVSIRGRSADLTGALRKRETRTWRDTTLGAILTEIAGRHSRTARIGGDLAARAIAVIEQEGKSDMAFLRDLGKRYDAIATWKDNFLLFLPIGGGTTAGGAPIEGMLLTRRDGWSWTFREGQRESYKGAEAQWHDSASGRRRTVKVDGPASTAPEASPPSGGGTAGPQGRTTPPEPKKLKRVYATEAEARQAAEAAASRAARTPYEFTYDIAIADPAIQPDMKVTLRGWNPVIDGIAWLVKSVETSFDGSGGLRQRLELESA